MKFSDYTLEFANRVLAANDEKPWYEGMEPPVFVHREELNLDIPIKKIEFSEGKMRIVI